MRVITPLFQLALLVTLAACSVSWSSHSTVTFSNPEFGHVRVETLPGNRVAVVRYHEGRLLGADALPELQAANSWIESVCEGRQAVDHPELPRWREQLQRMQAAAAAGGDDPVALATACTGFPFARAVRDCTLTWVGDSPARAALMLDRLARVDLDEPTATELCRLALQQQVDDGRLAFWIEGLADDDHAEAVLLLARSAGAGRRTATVVLHRLGEFSSSEEVELFETTAFQLVGDPGSSRLLLQAVDELPGSVEGKALLGLLRTPHCSPELAMRTAEHLDDFRSHDRDELLRECGRLLVGDARGSEVVAAALDELRTSSRFAVARRLLELPADAGLIVALLRVIDDLPSRDRHRLLDAVLAEPLWNEAIARAAAEAVEAVTQRERERLRRQITTRRERGLR